jgi:drug/metabolite transporter (DMT)-like permease
MKSPARGIALKIGGTLSFAVMFAIIKLLHDVPIGEIVFFRAFFALIPVLLFSTRTVGPLELVKTKRPFMHLARSLVGVTSMFMGFTAVTILPLADVTAFGFAMPIFAVVLAALILHERVGKYRWSAVLAGFAGVLVMLSPHGGLSHILTHGITTGAGLALSSAFLAAVVVILIRQMHATERGETIVFYFMVTCSTVGAITMIWYRVPLTLKMAELLVLCGLLGGVGQLCMTFSYRYAEPSLLAPFDYTAMIWAVALGYAVFREVPEPLVMLGAAMVISAGLFIVWREHRLNRITVERAGPVL